MGTRELAVASKIGEKHSDPQYDADFVGSPLESSASVGSSGCDSPRRHRIQLDPLNDVASNASNALGGGSTSLPESSRDVHLHEERDEGWKQGGGSLPTPRQEVSVVFMIR